MLTVLVLFLLVCIIFIQKLGNAKKGDILFFMFIFLLILYNNKDVHLLPDLAPYKDVFLQMKESFKESMTHYHNEIGYGMFNYVIHYVIPNYYVFLFIHSIIIIICNLTIIKRYSSNLIFSFILYVATCFFSMFLLRQYLAIAICLLSIPSILNRNFKVFFILTLCATTFHTTAFIWFIVYFLYFIPFNKKGLLLLFTFLFVFSLGLQYLFNNLQNYTLFWKLEYYSTSEITNYTWKNFAISIFIVMFLCVALRKEIFKLDGVNKLFFLLLFMSLCFDYINMIGTSFSAFYRIKLYFNWSIIFLIPYAVTKIKNRFLQYGAVFFFILLYSYLQYNTIEGQGGFKFII